MSTYSSDSGTFKVHDFDEGSQVAKKHNADMAKVRIRLHFVSFTSFFCRRQRTFGFKQ